jgi:hypothetical protein
MARDRASVKFTMERTYTVRRPEIALFESVAFLDTARLAKGSHKLEIGTVEGCDSAVTATVRNGMVTGVEFPRCAGTSEIPPVLDKRLKSARQELARAGESKWQDIPVTELVRMAAARIVVSTGGADEDGCYWVCIDPGDGRETCWMCCPTWSPPCMGPSEPQMSMI